jgi:hypothetical protein
LIIDDHDRANVLRDKNLGDFSQCPMRLGRDDISTLGGEYARDCHFCLPEKILQLTFDRFCFGCPQAAANHRDRMRSVSCLRKSALSCVLKGGQSPRGLKQICWS